jgi:hypothetical protein
MSMIIADRESVGPDEGDLEGGTRIGNDYAGDAIPARVLGDKATSKEIFGIQRITLLVGEVDDAWVGSNTILLFLSLLLISPTNNLRVSLELNQIDIAERNRACILRWGRLGCLGKGFRPSGLLKLVADVRQMALLMTLIAHNPWTADVGVSIGKLIRLAMSTFIISAFSKMCNICFAKVS